MQTLSQKCITNHQWQMGTVISYTSKFLQQRINCALIMLYNSTQSSCWSGKLRVSQKMRIKTRHLQFLKISPNWLSSQKPQTFNLKKMFKLRCPAECGSCRIIELCVCVCPVCVHAEQRLWNKLKWVCAHC